ncbi:ATP synthase subunit 9, mitochondrial [Populus nigra]|uniref:ATP synthase subunit 9, mitochondrial n=1 Tax=Populus nigra TaxID=3691 RepID=UPI002B27676E|nr:ATP synthase subunit 9, mitochondrial [Populus nigra]
MSFVKEDNMLLNGRGISNNRARTLALRIRFSILNRQFLLGQAASPRFYRGVALKPIFCGNVFSSLIRSVARNPSLAKQLFGYAILGFALTEAIALFALMMRFLILLYF